MTKIFISYRRADQDVAIAIYSAMGNHFGERNIFFDSNFVSRSAEFKRIVVNAINNADVVLVIIGQDWVRMMEERAFGEYEDYVYMEIEHALRQKKVVIPVLVDDSEMPEFTSLLHNIRGLQSYKRLKLRSGLVYMPSDFDRLAKGIEQSTMKPYSMKRIRLALSRKEEKIFVEERQRPVVYSRRATKVEFVAYYPPATKVDASLFILVFIRASDFAEKTAGMAKTFFADKQGVDAIDSRKGRKTANIKHGAELMVRLECDELEFDPINVTKKWKGDYLQFEFNGTPIKAGELHIHAVIYLHGIEIASVDNCIISVSETTNNIYFDAKQNHSKGYLKNNVFVSYSSRDKVVANRYRLAQKAIGNDIFMDIETIRAGESWQKAIADAIDRADIFQLFWSPNSASSDYVRQEWEYALNHKCKDDCIGFIRPVYWRKPMPPPPEELGLLHFKFLPLEEGKSMLWYLVLVPASIVLVIIIIMLASSFDWIG